MSPNSEFCLDRVFEELHFLRTPFTTELPLRFHIAILTMEHDPETAALIKKYPSLAKAIETGIEVNIPISTHLNPQD